MAYCFLFPILLQFRLAYVDLESTVVGAGQLVDDPKKIASHYLRGKFLTDFFIVLPIPQVSMLELHQFFLYKIVTGI